MAASRGAKLPQVTKEGARKEVSQVADRTLPPFQLRLDWVYGYRGYQCRSNVYYISSGEIVYFVAGVGIVMDIKQRKQRFFLGHDDDIISLALHPNNQLVATGQVGKAPQICIWDALSLQTVSILKGVHARGVACVSFGGPDGKMLVSAGLEDDHVIAVWDWKKGSAIAQVKGHNDRIFDVQFHPKEPNLIVSCGIKHIKFWNVSGNTLTGKKGIFGKAGELQTQLCIAFGQQDQVTYTGGLNGEVYKWRGNNLESTISGAHLGGIFTMDTTPDGFATGSKDGTVRLWDNNFAPITLLNLGTSPIGYPDLCVRSVCWRGQNVLCGTKDSEIVEISVKDKNNPTIVTRGHGEGELWSLAPHPSKNIFATASDDKTIRIWDAEKRIMLLKVATKSEVRSVAFGGKDGDLLAAGMKDGSFGVYLSKDLSLISRTVIRKEVLHEMKFSPNGQILAVGSNDNFVDFFDVANNFKKLGECTKASSFITHLDFSQDGKYIQTNSGAGERLIYEVPTGRHVTKKQELDSISWKTWTCVLGEPVNGIWGKYMQTNDINACDTSSRGAVVTGDDFGMVKLFRYPCMKAGAQGRQYTGHSAHVTNIRFTQDGLRVMSTGGGDNAVFQWGFFGEGEAPPQLGYESCEEKSDSDNSDVAEVDSDIERETAQTYEREVVKEEVAVQKIDSSVKRAPPPDRSLTLSFVHGYRGYDCRSNLYATKNECLVYHVAAVGIVYDPSAHKQKFYTMHTDDILCLALRENLVATGQVGKDPTIHVWNADTMETVAILQKGHTRGVCALDFSPDGTMLASVGLDDDHTIVVWEWAKGRQVASTRAHKDKIFLIRWNPFKAGDIVAVGVKFIKFFTLAGGGFTSKRGIFGKAGSVDTMLSIAFGKDTSVFTGAASGLIYRWKENNLEATIKAHEGPVFCIISTDKGFLSGGKDGCVVLWSPSFEKVTSFAMVNSSLVGESPLFIHESPSIRGLAICRGKIIAGSDKSDIVEIDKTGKMNILTQGHGEGEIWGLATHPSKHMFATVSDDKTVRLWDAERNQVLVATKLKKAARCVAFSPDGAALAVGLNDGSFMVLQTDNLSKLASEHHRKEEISDIKFSPGSGKYLAVASHDNFVDVYNVGSSTRVGTCKGASSYITHIDWDEHGKVLMVNSGAKELLFFEAPRGTRQNIRNDVMEKMRWSSFTGVLGHMVEGIWPPSSDITDVNATHLTSDGKTLATGDDFGFVKLFEYPVVGKHAKFKKYMGHSAHVTNVRWMYDDSFLVSVGGADTSVMIWSTGKVSGGLGGNHAVRGNSDDSNTDEDEDGYDTDVDHETKIDYLAKIYATPHRDTRSKPTVKEEVGKVSRSKAPATKVIERDTHGHIPVGLELSFIHGYRGFDSRNNLKYISEETIVYHAAAACIVYNLRTNTQSFYLEHDDDILCLATHPKKPSLVATGQIGSPPLIHVWDSAILKRVSVIQVSHEMGVSYLSFSPSGSFLLSVGLGAKFSTVGVHRWERGELVALKNTHCRRVFAAEFRPESETQFVTCGVKHVRFWTIAGSDLISKRGVYGPGSKTQTMLSVACGAPGVTYTGAMSGEIFVWKDCQNVSIIGSKDGGHSGPVFSLCSISSCFFSGSKDGTVKVWNHGGPLRLTHNVGCAVRSVHVLPSKPQKVLVGTKLNSIYEAIIDDGSSSSKQLIGSHAEGEVWGLAVHPSKPWFASGGDDTRVCVFDLASSSLVSTTTIAYPARSLAFSNTHNNGDLLAVGTRSGQIVVLDTQSFKPVLELRDRKSTILDLKFSPDDRYLVAASEDKSIDIYSVQEKFKRVGTCKEIKSPVTHIDWSSDCSLIQANTLEYEMLHFSIPEGQKRSVDKSKLVLDTWTGVLGDEVVGIWPKNSQNGDINSTHLSNSGKLLATGDDFGYVKIFDFPCDQAFARHVKYIGHSADVTNVRFSRDDRFLISTGGDDSCVFVWKTIGEK